MLNNFIYAQTKELFLEQLNAGNILDEAIVFIEDSKEIWNRGHYFGTIDPELFSGIQTAIDSLNSNKLDSSIAEDIYTKKVDLPNFSDYLTKNTASSLYATIAAANGLQENINNINTDVANLEDTLDTKLDKSLLGNNTLIHSGNVGEYNAGSAIKLETPRTIWGQSFDGTKDVSGDITMNNYSAIKFKNAAGTSALNAMMVDSNNYLTIGYDLAANSVPTRIDGSQVFLRYGSAHTNGFILNSSGNVGIGTTSPAQKLDVSGNIIASGYVSGGMCTATSINAVPITHNSCKCTISASGSFALASTPVTGRTIHTLVYNSSSADVVVSLPTASPYVNFGEDSLTIPAGGYSEINVISDGSTMFIRHAA